MPPSALDFVEQYLSWLAIVASLVLYLRLRREGLNKTYQVFSVYLLFRGLRGICLVAVPPLWRALQGGHYVPFSDNLYGWIWILTEPVMWVFYVLIVLELYSLVLQNYRGIASLSRWALFAGLGIALVLASLTLSTDLSNPAEKFPILRYMFAIERGVVSSLVLFLLSITGFLVWFPVPLSRNVVVYSILYAVYFVVNSLVFLLRNVMGSDVTQMVNVFVSGTSILCLGAWTVLLNRHGESTKIRVRQAWVPRQEEQLIQQLAAINSTLLRAARK